MNIYKQLILFLAVVAVSVLFSNAGTVQAAVALVQKVSSIASSASTLTATLPSAVTSGNLIVVSVSSWSHAPAATAITDSLGNTYVMAGSAQNTGASAYSAIFYAKNIVAGNDTVTFKLSSSGNEMSMVVSEFQGIDTVTPLDVAKSASGSGTAPSSGNMTPTATGDLVIGAGTHNNTRTTTAGGGFTMIAVATEDTGSHQPLAMEYRVATSTAATSTTFTLSSSDGWAQNGALFKATSSGPDTTSPSVPSALTATATSTSQINLSWIASTDPDSAVAGYQIFRNGIQVATTSVTSFANTGLQASTTYTYTVTAFDPSGNISPQSSPASATTLSPDVTPPTVSITAPTDGSTVSSTVTLSANASDNVAVASVQFKVDGVVVATDSATPYTASWNSATFSNGTHSIAATAIDTSGNTATSPTVSVTISNPDITPPTVSITAPTDGSTVSSTVTLSANASDNVAVASVQFKVDGVVVATDSATPYTASWNSATLPNGTHSIAATAIDTSGNTATSPTVRLTISNTVTSTSLIALVQKASAVLSSNAQLAAILPSTVTAGNLIVVSVSSWPNLPVATGAITDSLGNAYTIAGQVLTTGSNSRAAVYYAKNVLGGSDTVTFRASGSGNEMSVVVAEFSGADTVSPLNGTAGATGSSNAPSSGNLMPSVTGDLVIGAGTHDASLTTTAGTNFNMIAVATEDAGSHQPLAMEYRVLTSSTATTPATFSLSRSASWAQSGALFKAAGGGGTPPPSDTTSPTTSITIPASGATLSGVTSVTVTASDNVGVTRVELYVDSSLWSTNTTSPYTFSLDTTTFLNGAHVLSAKAYDAAGNVGTNASVSVTISNATSPGQTPLWSPIVDVGPGYVDSFSRQVVRSSAGFVYIFANESCVKADCATSIRAYKGSPAGNPTSFAEMDAAHHPTDSARIAGMDARMANDDIAKISYDKESNLTQNYITFNTNTDTWGTSEMVSAILGSEDLPYRGQNAIALDANGIPHIIFGGSNEGLRYSNRISGTWSAPVTVVGGTSRHPSLSFDTNGVLRLAYLNLGGSGSIRYIERNASGTWGSIETVAATNSDEADESPSLAIDAEGRSIVAMNQGENSGTPYCKLFERTGLNTWIDVSPPSNVQGHNPSVYINDDNFYVLLGHDESTIEPSVDIRSPGGAWGVYTMLATAPPTRDGSSDVRWDLLWPGSQNDIDATFFNENAGTIGELYYVHGTQ